MTDIQIKIKTWVDAITKEKMSKVAEEMEESLHGKLTSAENKAIFKVLLYLSHAAAKGDKTRSELGVHVWSICRCICSKLTDIPDAKKFFASIFHIASCLLGMGMYKEAMETTDYVLPGRLWKNELPDGAGGSSAEMYTKIGNMMRASSLALLKRTGLTTRKSLEIVLALVRYDLDATKLAHARNSCWRHVLAKIQSYCEQVGAIVKKSDKSGACSRLREEFETAMLTYIGQEKVELDDDNNNQTYRLIFRIVNEMTVRNINARGIESAEDNLPRYLDAFRGFLRRHDEHLRCFNLYERWMTALVRPLKNLSSSTEREIAACVIEHDSIKNNCEDPEAVKWYSYSAVVPIGELLVYWEECAKTDNDGSQCLGHALNTTFMSFLRAHSDIFARYTPVYKCGCGGGESQRRCNLAEDAYTGLIVKIKALAVISRAFGCSSSAVFTERMVRETLGLCETSRARIQLMRRARCRDWSVLWSRCGVHFYNIGVSCEYTYRETAKKIYGLLLTSFVEFEGLASLGGREPSLLVLRDPLPTILHRITSLEYKRGCYESAMFHCALNGLLGAKIPTTTTSGGKSKVYSTWAFIKNKHPASRKFTMLTYLRSQEAEIARLLLLGDTLHWDDYDLAKVCLREIEGLACGPFDATSSITAVVDELERLKVPAASYAQGVQWLGYHLLNNPGPQQLSIANYLRKAAQRDHESRTTTSLRWRQGHLKFHEFVERIREMNAKTAAEMEDMDDMEDAAKTRDAETEGAVDGGGGGGGGSGGGGEAEGISLGACYSNIRVSVLTKMASHLESALRAWKRAFEADANYKDSLEAWEYEQTLRMLIVAGEYARLYDLEGLEVEAWRMAFELARELSDHRAIVYVVGRSLDSQQKRVDRRWIEAAEESVRKIERSDEAAAAAAAAAARDKKIVVNYRLSLADLYYQNGDVEAATRTFRRATSKVEDLFASDDANFLLGAHIRMSQTSLAEDTDDQFKYSELIVRRLYSLLAIGDALDVGDGDKTNQLLSYDRVFEFTDCAAPLMNALLGITEITAHLRRILKMAQKLGATLRVAECLKSLCHIDLSRAKLDECEVKLQRLEHILEIEGFDVTMKSSISREIPARIDAFATESTNCLVETVRDVFQGDASPVLRKKVFAPPDFLVHGDSCLCFKCTNSRYRNLVFAATHIRAQLFSLRRNAGPALDHFEGAMTIKMNMLEKKGREYAEAARIDDNVLRSRRHLEDVEYVAIHLDYCRFLKWAMPQNVAEGIEIALDALELCEKYNMRNHPLYAATNLLLCEYRFENAYSQADFSKFTVPAIDETDVDRFIVTPRIAKSKGKSTESATPAREKVEPKAMPVRRKKAPLFLRLEKVPIDLTEEEQGTLEEAEKGPAAEMSTSPPARTRPIRRRGTTEAREDSNQSDARPERAAKPAVSRMKFSIPVDDVVVAATADLATPKREREKIADARRARKVDADAGSSARKMEKFVEEIKTGPPTVSQRESSSRTRSRKLSRRGSGSDRSIDDGDSSSASDSSYAPVVPTIEISQVTEMLADLTVQITPSRSTRSRRGATATTNANIDEITLSSDGGACSSSDELETRRVSSRLRKKSHDPTAMPGSSDRAGTSNSEDEVVIIKTRFRRRVASATEKSTAAKK